MRTYLAFHDEPDDDDGEFRNQQFDHYQRVLDRAIELLMLLGLYHRVLDRTTALLL